MLIAVTGQFFSSHLHKHIYIYIYIYIYSSRDNTVAGNLFILRFLVLPHLHKERGSWMLRALWKEGENGAAAISTHF